MPGGNFLRRIITDNSRRQVANFFFRIVYTVAQLAAQYSANGSTTTLSPHHANKPNHSVIFRCIWVTGRLRIIITPIYARRGAYVVVLLRK